MTTHELEQQVLSLDLASRIRILQVLAQSLTTAPSWEPDQSLIPTSQPVQTSIVDFFRHSPLCEVTDELDLRRDQSPIPDRIIL